MRRRVGLYLGVEPSIGGTFQYNQTVVEAVAALPSTDYEVTVAWVYPGWRPRLERLGVDHAQVFPGVWAHGATKVLGIQPGVLRGWRRLGRHVHPVIRHLQQARCDLWVFPSQDALTYQAGVPALGVIHDLMHRYERRFPEVSARGRGWYRDRHYRAMCRWSSLILVDSPVGQRHVEESYGLEPERIAPVPFVAPRAGFAATTPPGFDDRHRLPQRYVFYPAQLWHHKNHVGLLRAVSLLKTRYPDLHLVLAGSRKNASDLVVRAVRTLGLDDRVHLLGYVSDEDLGELYRRARALVMPTFFGPTNIPPLEAFAVGCPVAVSNIYGMPDQLGDAALYFDPSSPTAIAGGIERLWTDEALRRELASRGRARAERWTQDHFNHAFEAALRRALDLGPPR